MAWTTSVVRVAQRQEASHHVVPEPLAASPPGQPELSGPPDSVDSRSQLRNSQVTRQYLFVFVFVFIFIFISLVFFPILTLQSS